MLKPLIERLSRAKSAYNRDLLINHEVTFFANSPLYWNDRAEELGKLLTYTPKTPAQATQKHADLMALIESLKTERKSYQASKEVPSSTRKTADAELVKLSLLAVRNVKSLREAYPELSAPQPEPSAPFSLRAAFLNAASKAGEWTNTIRSNPHVQKIGHVSSAIATAAATRIANDLNEISAPLRQNIADAIQDTKIVIKDHLNNIPLVRNIDWSNPQHRRLTTCAASYVAIFGLAAGVVSHISGPDVKKTSEPEIKPITFQFEPAKIAKSDEDVFDRPLYQVEKPSKKASKPAATKTRKSSPVYTSSRKDFSEENFYSFEDSDLENKHKNLKGHKLSKWNWDALLKPKYREVLVSATHKLLQMSPTDVFKGLLMTESGGRQFDAKGRVVVSSAGATGAAQVMPNTARLIAPRCTGDNIDWHRFKNDRDYNIKMGKCYFHEQHETFGNNNVAALLAYNGGPGSDTMRAGLKHNLRKAGISLSNDGETMVELIGSIRNTENRHYTLITMAKLGLIDPNDLGDDVTNGYRGTPKGHYSDSPTKESRTYRWEVPTEEPRQETPSSLREEFHRGSQILKGRDLSSRSLSTGPSFQTEDEENKHALSRHQDKTTILANANDPIERAATLD